MLYAVCRVLCATFPLCAVLRGVSRMCLLLCVALPQWRGGRRRRRSAARTRRILQGFLELHRPVEDGAAHGILGVDKPLVQVGL